MFVATVDIPSGIPPYTVHQYLYGYFPQHPPDAPRPFLFRRAESRCLLVSRIRPACPHVELHLDAGRAYAMEGLMVPTQKRRDAAGKLVDIPLVGNAARRDWFVEVLSRHGARVGFCQWYDRPKITFRHANGHAITLQPAQMKAMALVTDESEFGELLLRGLGRGKAFGYGMLYLPALMDPAAAMRAA